MIVAVVLFWGSLAALAWTHVLYPATVALAARVRTKRVALDDGYLPSVAVIVTAYNEEDVIERRLENLRALDYPPELLSSSSPPMRPPTAPRSWPRRPARA